MCVSLLGYGHFLFFFHFLTLTGYIGEQKNSSMRVLLQTYLLKGILSQILRFVRGGGLSPVYTKKVQPRIQSRHGNLVLSTELIT